MDLRALQDGASCCREPAKTAGDIQLSDGAAGLTATGNFSEDAEGFIQFLQIQCRAKGEEPVAVQQVGQLEEFQPGTVKNDPDIEEFFPFDPGNDTDDGIFK